jgi:hypothetical protein
VLTGDRGFQRIIDEIGEGFQPEIGGVFLGIPGGRIRGGTGQQASKRCTWETMEVAT